MTKFRTHYDNLKVARNAPNSVVKAAYKALIQQHHPDKNQESGQEAYRITKIIIQSYEILIDPVKRKEHDRWIAEQEAKKKQWC
jgi:DnaJ-class molecular chaperone